MNKYFSLIITFTIFSFVSAFLIIISTLMIMLTFSDSEDFSTNLSTLVVIILIILPLIIRLLPDYIKYRKNTKNFRVPLFKQIKSFFTNYITYKKNNKPENTKEEKSAFKKLIAIRFISYLIGIGITWFVWTYFLGNYLFLLGQWIFSKFLGL